MYNPPTHSLCGLTYPNSLGDSADLTIWSIVEIMIGILCTCIPALKPLFKRFLGTMVSTGDRGVNHGKGSGSSGQTPNGPRTTVYAGTRRLVKEAHESEESIFTKTDLELGIRVTQEMGVRISENRSVSSMEEGATRGKVLS